ncbi:MAG: glycosyltransferase family 2 protein [Candidatus Dojkabacteria bacterium]|nr:MAG: glycosyltransferase family 2 protein [Candidatus Dojkabacteria bacterium]
MPGKTAILIVSYNATENLKACLESLRWTEGREEYKVFLGDNSSSNVISAMVTNEYPWVAFSMNEVNLGFAKGMNRLCAQAVTEYAPDYILLVNPDMRIDSQSIELMKKSLDNGEKIAAVGPKLLDDENNIEDSVITPPKFHLLFMKFMIHGLTGSERISLNYDPTSWSRAQAISGACMLIRRVAIDDAGFFNERFFMYFEDVEFCWRLRKKGWEIYYDPNAIAHHSRGKSSEEKEDVRRWRAEQTYISLITYFSATGQKMDLWLTRLMILGILRARILLNKDADWSRTVIDKIKSM